MYVGERPDLLTIDGDYPEQLILFQHRHGKKSAGFRQLNSRHTRWFALGIGRFSGNIGNVDWLLSLEHPTKSISWVRARWLAPKIIAEGRLGILQGHRVEHMAVEPVQDAKVG